MVFESVVVDVAIGTEDSPAARLVLESRAANTDLVSEILN